MIPHRKYMVIEQGGTRYEGEEGQGVGSLTCVQKDTTETGDVRQIGDFTYVCSRVTSFGPYGMALATWKLKR